MKRALTLIITILFVLFICACPISADKIQSGFSYEQLPDEYSQTEIIKAISLEKTSKEYVGPSYICSFDVNRLGELAVAFDNMFSKHINIYDDNGKFQYGYVFTVSGGYLLEYDLSDNLLMIHTFRGNSLLKIDRDGQIVDMVLTDESQENSNYETQLDTRTIISRNGNEYIRSSKLPNWLLVSLNYTIITKRTVNNNTSVIYDNSMKHNFIFFAILFIIIFFCIVVISIVIGGNVLLIFSLIRYKHKLRNKL